MLCYDYEIVYKKGWDNIMAYAFSRHFKDKEIIFSLSFPIPNWIEEANKEWFTHPSLSQIIKRLQEDPNSPIGYTWKEVILRYKDRVVLSPNSTLKPSILT